MVYFNATVGERTNASELVTVHFGLDERNMAEEEMYETAFDKKTTWICTWISPNGKPNNEIGYIMTNKPSTICITVVYRINDKIATRRLKLTIKTERSLCASDNRI